MSEEHIVPNQFPSLEPSDLRIAICGQSPGEDESHQGIPFVGRAGRLLDDALERVGLVRGRIFAGNICQRRPNKENDFDRLEWDGPWVQEGIAQLRADLEKFRPNIVLCLGNEALHLFKNGNVVPRKKWEKGRRVFDWKDKIGNWRGSLFESGWLGRDECQNYHQVGDQEFAHQEPCEDCHGTGWLHGVKCLAAYHPAFVVRDNYAPQVYYRVAPGVGDLERLKIEAATPGLELPRRDVKIYIPSTDDQVIWGVQAAIEMLKWLAKSPKPVAVDIEGGPGNITCIAFATRRDVAHVIPLAGIDGRSIWAEEQEVAIWEGVKVILEDARIPKIVMNAGYDFFALPWTYGITPRGELLDIMESFWEWQPELKLGLATQVSLLTRWPFYKPDKEEGELKFPDNWTFWNYCGHDSGNNVECFEETMKRLSKGQCLHFRFNTELGAFKLFGMLRGVKVDMERVKEERAKAQRAAWELQVRIDREASAAHGPDDLFEFCFAFKDALPGEEWFAGLCLARLGGKNPAVPKEVVVERWQPMRHNGKRWVKAGRLLDTRPAPYEFIEQDCEPAQSSDKWLKPAHKTITRRLPFTPTTLTDCEEHVLESKRAEWKRVKAIWKELKHEQRTVNQTAQAVIESISNDGGEGGNPKTDRTRLENTRAGCSALLGELSLLLGLGVNTGSNNEGGDSQWFLYEVCGLPRIFKNERTGKYSRESEKEWKARIAKGVGHAAGSSKRARAKAGGGQPSGVAADEANPSQDPVLPKANPAGEGVLERSEKSLSEGAAVAATTDTTAATRGKKISTDQQVLDLLYAHTKDERCLWVLQQRRLRKVVSDLKGDLVDHDGRARSSVSFVKETGRMAESEAPHGTGLGNRQALNKDLRRIVIAG